MEIEQAHLVRSCVCHSTWGLEHWSHSLKSSLNAPVLRRPTKVTLFMLKMPKKVYPLSRLHSRGFYVRRERKRWTDHEIHPEETDTIDVYYKIWATHHYTTGSTANLVGFGTFNGSMTKPRKTAKQWQWQTWFVWTPTMADMYGTNNVYYQWRDFILATCNKHATSNQHTTPLSCSIILPWFYYSQTFWTWSTWTNCKTYSQQMIYHGRKVPAIFIMQSHEQKLKTIGPKDLKKKHIFQSNDQIFVQYRNLRIVLWESFLVEWKLKVNLRQI